MIKVKTLAHMPVPLSIRALFGFYVAVLLVADRAGKILKLLQSIDRRLESLKPGPDLRS